MALQGKLDSAPGADGISYKMYAQLPQIMKIRLLTTYNQIFQTNTIPPHWKKHLIIPIPKPGWDGQDISKIRPIALASCSKFFFERMLRNRLEHWVQKNNKIPSWQFAFIKGRGTQICLGTLLIDTLMSTIRKEYCGILLFDLKNAYNNVNIECLLARLINIGLPTRWIKILSSLLRDNCFQISTPNYTTPPRKTDAGLIQGDILSPLLFNLYTVSLGTNVRKHARFLQYADDVAIYIYQIRRQI